MYACYYMYVSKLVSIKGERKDKQENVNETYLYCDAKST